MAFLEKAVEVVKICYFQTYELQQNNASKHNEGHCDKTTLQIFFHFYNSEYLCFIDIQCQNSAKNIQWFRRRSLFWGFFFCYFSNSGHLGRFYLTQFYNSETLESDHASCEI